MFLAQYACAKTPAFYLTPRLAAFCGRGCCRGRHCRCAAAGATRAFPGRSSPRRSRLPTCSTRPGTQEANVGVRAEHAAAVDPVGLGRARSLMRVAPKAAPYNRVSCICPGDRPDFVQDDVGPYTPIRTEICATNRDWNLSCYMALVAIDRPTPRPRCLAINHYGIPPLLETQP